MINICSDCCIGDAACYGKEARLMCFIMRVLAVKKFLFCTWQETVNWKGLLLNNWSWTFPLFILHNRRHIGVGGYDVSPQD